MRFNGTTIPNYRDETYDTSEVSRYKSSSSGDIEVEVLNVTENGTYTAPDGKAYSPVNVNVAGGGSSDFSTATITIATGNGLNVLFPLLDKSMGMLVPFDQTYPDGTYEIVLWGDGTLVMINELEVLISGNIQQVENAVYLITGDCTITTSPK